MFEDMIDGGVISRDRLQGLNEILRKAATAGYGTPPGISGGDTGPIAPLVPQSIESMVSVATFDPENRLWLWKLLSQAKATATIHEFRVISEHGQDTDPFFAESALPAVNTGEYTGDFVKVRYLGETREVSDVANLVGIMGPDPTALARETASGTASLLKKLEVSLFHAQNRLNPLGFDGFFRTLELKAPDNVLDLDGAELTFEHLREMLFKVYEAPLYGEIDRIAVTPQQFRTLVDSQTQFSRYTSLNLPNGARLVDGVGKLAVMGPMGEVEIEPATWLARRDQVPTAAAGNPTTRPGAVVIDSEAVAVNPDSDFLLADAGTYTYKIAAYNGGGVSAAAESAAVVVAQGEAVTITIDDAASKPAYYKVWRSVNGGPFQYLRSEPANAAALTEIVDDNTQRAGASSSALISMDPRKIAFVKLLDFLRRPLAQTSTSIPFALMCFGSLMMQVPRHHAAIVNAR
jgi:hypothetical protein